MEFPSKLEILDAFGIEPVDEDAGMAYRRYLKRSDDGNYELEFSFSAVMDSFQVVLRCGGKELMIVSSERVQEIKIRNDRSGSGIHVVFDFDGATSEVVLILQPDLHCRWGTLRT